MTSLITNTKPNPLNNKMVAKKLSSNAVKYLFPIREQKLLFKRSGKDGTFGKTKVYLKVEEIVPSKQIGNTVGSSFKIDSK